MCKPPCIKLCAYLFPQWICCSAIFFSGLNFFWTSSKFLNWFYYFYQFYFFSVMTWCLYFLTKHPEVQEKVYQEIEEVLEDEDIKPMVSSDLKSVTQVLFWSRPSFHSQYRRTPPRGHFDLPGEAIIHLIVTTMMIIISELHSLQKYQTLEQY